LIEEEKRRKYARSTDCHGNEGAAGVPFIVDDCSQLLKL